MEQYLVRKRPFAEHAQHAPPPKRNRAQQQAMTERRQATGSNGSAAAAAAASSYGARFQPASAVAASSSSASYSSARPSWRPPPQQKQLTLTQLAKVTDLDDVSARVSFIKHAFEQRDWRRLRDLLREMQGVFITKQTLEQTGVGRIITAIKNSARQPAAAASAASSSSAASASPASTPPPAAAAAASSAGSGTTSASAATFAASSAAAVPALQSECIELSAGLQAVWKAQVQKELAADAASGRNGGPALDFSQHSTMKSRVRVYKRLYFLLTERDAEESYVQKNERRTACIQLLAKDPDAAAVASELETMLFRIHRAQQVEQQLSRSKNELLSAQSSHAAREDEPLVTEPPYYASHARNLLQAVQSQAHVTARLRAWVTRGYRDEPDTPEVAAQRKACMEEILRSTRF